MKKHMRFSGFAVLLALSLLLATSVMAAGNVSTTATVPVTLTVTNEYRAVNVTVPASLPVEVHNGTVITANNAKIVNNSPTTPIKVTAITVSNGAYMVGDYDNFYGSTTIALKINGCSTHGPGMLQINDSAFPRISASNSLPLTYYAKVSGDAEATTGLNAASVVFTIALVD